MDSSCPPALTRLRLVAGVLEVLERAAAGDLAAAAEVDALAALLGCGCPVPGSIEAC